MHNEGLGAAFRFREWQRPPHTGLTEFITSQTDSLTVTFEFRGHTAPSYKSSLISMVCAAHLCTEVIANDTVRLFIPTMDHGKGVTSGRDRMKVIEFLMFKLPRKDPVSPWDVPTNSLMTSSKIPPPAHLHPSNQREWVGQKNVAPFTPVWLLPLLARVGAATPPPASDLCPRSSGGVAVTPHLPWSTSLPGALRWRPDANSRLCCLSQKQHSTALLGVMFIQPTGCKCLRWRRSWLFHFHGAAIVRLTWNPITV